MRGFAGVVVVLGLVLTGSALAGDAADVKVTGSVLERLELVNNATNFDGDVYDRVDGVLSRVRLGFDASLADGVSARVVLQNYGTWGDDLFSPVGGAIDGDEDDIEVYEAFIKLDTVMPFEGSGGKDIPLTIAIGRMEITLGDEMLLGDDSRYDGNSFDAVHLTTDTGDGLLLGLVLASVTEGDAVDMSAAAGSAVFAPGSVSGEEVDTYLFGLYGTYKGVKDTTIDGYVLVRDRNGTGDDLTFAGDPAIVDELRYTLGARYVGKFEIAEKQELEVKGEIAAQFGDQGADGDISAFGGELVVGWTPNKGAPEWETCIALNLAYASGDDDGTDDEDGRFDPLYGDVDGRLGKADYLILSNVLAYGLEVTTKPKGESGKVNLGLGFLMATAVEEDDTMAGGQAGVPGDDAILTEVDVWAGYKVTDNLSLEAGVCYIMPDDYLTGGGQDDEVTRIFLEASLKF